MKDLGTRVTSVLDSVLGPRWFPPRGVERTALLAVAVIYSAWLLAGIHRHEPWADEAQAWLIARDSGFLELQADRLRYEGTPGLWHVLLAVPARLGLPYESLHVVAACAAVAGVMLVLFASPLPTIVKVLVPFSYFPGYQWSIVARSYCLLLPILAALAWIWPHRKDRPVLVSCLCLLLSQVSLHGFLLAGVLVAVLSVEALRGWRGSAGRPLVRRLAPFLPMGVLIAAAVFAAWQLALPSDLSVYRGGGPRWKSWAHLLGRFERMCRGATGIQVPAAAAVLVSSLALLLRPGAAVGYALSMAAMTAFFGMIYFNETHAGVVVVVALAWAWVHYAQPCSPWRSRAVGAVLIVLMGMQLPGTVGTWMFDVLEPFSGSEDAAEFLGTHGLDRKKVWARSYYSTSIQPYFEGNVFDNLGPKGGPAYYPWRDPAPIEARGDPRLVPVREGDSPRRYDVLVEDSQMPFRPGETCGFSLAHTSPGLMMFLNRPWETQTFRIWIRDTAVDFDTCPAPPVPASI